MKRYDKVLVDGLPDWRSALYYYRRYRKMGIAEMVGLVFVIFTIGQYIVAWAVYAEKKYTAVCSSVHILWKSFIQYRNDVKRKIILKTIKCMSLQESLFGSKLRKLQKKNKSAVNIDDLLNQIPTPSIKNTLPFQIVRGVWNTPRTIKNLFSDINQYHEQIREEKRKYELLKPNNKSIF